MQLFGLPNAAKDIQKKTENTFWNVIWLYVFAMYIAQK